MGTMRPRKYSDKQFIDAIRQTKGMVFLAAQVIGCEANTIHNRAKVSPELAAAIAEERAKVLDIAEQKLIEALERGEKWAVEFCLRTIGKSRGYVEKQEIETQTTTRLVIDEEIVEPNASQEGKATPSAS